MRDDFHDWFYDDGVLQKSLSPLNQLRPVWASDWWQSGGPYEIMFGRASKYFPDTWSLLWQDALNIIEPMLEERDEPIVLER